MQKYSQQIAEGVFPILGFYLWDWSWYFILLFYVLDALSKEILLHLQSKKILATQGGKEAAAVWKKQGIVSSLLGLGILALLQFLQYFLYPDFQFWKEINAFLLEKEMGVPQGMILLPLIMMNVWMQYKTLFLKANQHVKTKMSQMWANHIRYRIFIFSVVAIGLVFVYQVHPNESVLLWLAVALPFVYSVGITRSLKRLKH